MDDDIRLLSADGFNPRVIARIGGDPDDLLIIPEQFRQRLLVEADYLRDIRAGGKLLGKHGADVARRARQEYFHGKSISHAQTRKKRLDRPERDLQVEHQRPVLYIIEIISEAQPGLLE